MIRIFRVFIPTTVLFLALSEFVLLFGCLCLGYLAALSPINPDGTLELFLLQENGILRISLAVSTLMLGFYFQDLYTNFKMGNRIGFVQQLMMVVGLTFIGQALLAYASHELMLSRYQMIYGCSIIMVVMPIWRTAYSAFVIKVLGSQNILFVGDSDVLRQIAERVSARPEDGAVACGFLSPDGAIAAQDFAIPCLGSIADLDKIVATHKPRKIIVGMRERRQRLPVFKLLDLRLSGIHIEEASHAYESLFGKISTQELRPSQLVFSTELGPSSSSVSMQNLYSVSIAIIGTILSAPIMLLVAIMVRLTSPGPILHRQTRVGMKGEVFTVYKFRSMYQDAEARTGAVWASKNDPRITSIGKYLRRYRLDELPQFFNVLRGDMSMVGPRPERPEFTQALAEQIPFYRQRLCVKPGLTGWAQINHKYGDTMEDTNTKLEYDLYYIKHISLSLDIYILVNTAKIVILGRGAQ